MGNWGKNQERSVVRAVDVLCGVLSGAAADPARRVIAARALLVIEQHLFPAHEEIVQVENCQAAAKDASGDQWAHDAAVRRWLAEVLHGHASEYNDHHDLFEGDCGHVDVHGHPVWALLELSPLARRLRLLQVAAAQTGAGLGRAIGVGAHQLGHWTADRSRPGDAERTALAKVFGIHPAWLDASRDQEPDVQLYRFQGCPCENPGTMTRGDLGPGEPAWYKSAAEQAAAVLWCDGCGQPWLKETVGWLLPLPPGEEEIPCNGNLADGSHPAIYVHHRSLDTAWPPVLWRPPNHPFKRPRTRTAYLAPALLADEPQPVTAKPVAAPPLPPLPSYIRPEQRVLAHADRCRYCRGL
ncbi:hypothetical protein ACWC5I_47995, partial [Kitasatospora sp. NPDC001574]